MSDTDAPEPHKPDRKPRAKPATGEWVKEQFSSVLALVVEREKDGDKKDEQIVKVLQDQIRGLRTLVFALIGVIAVLVSGVVGTGFVLKAKGYELSTDPRAAREAPKAERVNEAEEVLDEEPPG